MSRFKTIIALIFAVVVALFAVQNYEEVVIKFLFYNLKISQALIIVLTTALGVVIGLVAGLNSAFKATKSQKQLSKNHAEAQQKLSALEEENAKLKAEIERLQHSDLLPAEPLDAQLDDDDSSQEQV